VQNQCRPAKLGAMKFTLISTSVLAIAVLLIPFTPASAHAGPSEAAPKHINADLIEVCEAHTLDPTDDLGNRLPEDTIQLHLMAVQSMCDAEGPEAAAPSNVGAIAAYTPASGAMLVRAYANSLPRATYALSCIYRYEPVSGSAGAWQDCGAVRDTNTYLTTRGNEWCPVPGTRWRVNASLFNANDRLIGSDDAWKVAA
jgi:hypothetical protein